jgi:acetyl esterase/lipase
MSVRRFVWLVCLVLLTFTVGGVSAQRSARPTAYNVFYDPEGDRTRLLDVYLPETGTAPYPVVLTFHGFGGNKTSENRDGIIPFILDQGYAVIGVGYTTALPKAYSDAACALAWVYTNADEYGLDVERIAHFGNSFGGLVATWLGAMESLAPILEGCPNQLPEDFRPIGVVTNAGAVLPSLEDIVDYLEAAPDDIQQVLEAHGNTMNTVRETAPTEWHTLELPDDVRMLLSTAFPIYFIDGDEPPHLLISGASDRNVPFTEALDYAAALAAVNVSVDVTIERLTGHVPPILAYDRELATFLARIFAE